MHRNNNAALGNYVIYEIVVNNITYKIGKADLDRLTQSSGNPTRIHQQVRKLRIKYGPQNVFQRVLEQLFGVTTAEAKNFERALLEYFYEQNGFVPEGNQKSFTPKPLPK